MADEPIQNELAKADHGLAMTTAFTDILLQNPDSVLTRRGWNYKIYDELLRDDQVHSTFQQRRTAVTRATWNVEPASEASQDVAAAEFLKEQLERIGWDDKTDKMMYGVFYGFAVAEVMWGVEGGQITIDDIKVRDRSRFRFDKDDNLFLINTQNPQGVQMPDYKFWTFNAGANHDDNKYGLGLAHSLYWPVFFKRSDIKFWLVFLEKFGMPTATVRLPDGQITNPEEIRKAKAVLAAFQADSGLIVPESMKLELLEAARSGTADYDALVERMDKAISKVVLSQTMTTDDGSSLSQAQVHKDVSQAVIDSDSDLINDSFRRSVATWLTEWNFPNAGVPKIVRETEPEEDLNERAERDSKIVQLGYEPTEEYIEETYGPGWRVKPPAPVPAQLMTDGTGPMPAEFSELNSLLQKRSLHREDQQSLKDAAEFLATQYNEIIGDRVRQILNYLDESDDIETFRRHLTTMVDEVAPDVTVDAVQKATVFARLMGMFRGQRN
ncbi:MAG: DUF935 family protein [Pseudomonadota bacterium]